MQRWLVILFLFICQISFGQIQSLGTCFQWFEKADKVSVQSFYQNGDSRLSEEKDSLGLHMMHYSIIKTTYGMQPHTYLFLNDTAVEFLSFEIYEHNEYKNILAQIKAQRFRSLGADVNGNYITTVYDNDRFLLCQDYEAVENPLGKGQLPYYRYRIYRKYGKFDDLNGEKTVMLSQNGTSYLGIRENYKNGLLSGERTFYYPNGTVKRKENYQAGRLNGLVSDYNEAGKLTHSVTHSYHWKYGMEKWYNNEGKAVKTLQWQRDVPVGTEKQTYNGTVIGTVTYVKGVKQGVAKVPIYYNELIETRHPLDTLNDEPLGIETVNYENGLKTGKAICLYFNSIRADTMYVCYYKAGELDSVYNRYGQYNVYYSTNYLNGLENGSRIFRIEAGVLKGSIFRVENYKLGKLDGQVFQYYRKVHDELVTQSDTDFEVAGGWTPWYSMETYTKGIKNGDFLFRSDSLNYSKGTYANGKLEGFYESEEIDENNQVKVSGYYHLGYKSGTWKTHYVKEQVVVKQDYEKDRKEGNYSKEVNGRVVEERVYLNGHLKEINQVDHPGDYDKFSFEKLNLIDSFLVVRTKKSGDITCTLEYLAAETDFLLRDTVLAELQKDILMNPESKILLNGKFQINTPSYEKAGMYKNGELDGSILIRHTKANVQEVLIYQNKLVKQSSYVSLDSKEPYSGTFMSAENNEQISVKDGLRHGWCIQYDSQKNEISRTKYKSGVEKKTVENTTLPKVI